MNLLKILIILSPVFLSISPSPFSHPPQKSPPLTTKRKKSHSEASTLLYLNVQATGGSHSIIRKFNTVHLLLFLGHSLSYETYKLGKHNKLFPSTAMYIFVNLFYLAWLNRTTSVPTILFVTSLFTALANRE